MSIASDADLFQNHFSELGLVPAAAARDYRHMGKVLVDAALQPNTKYLAVVEPRVQRLLQSWPDATTTTAFADRMAREDISRVLPWNGTRKLQVLRELTEALLELGVETVVDLFLGYTDPDLAPLIRARIRAIKGVGPKTIDYLAILAGVREHAAIDTRLINFAAEAGIVDFSYAHLSKVMRLAAYQMSCGAGDLDSPVWNHMGTR